MTTNDLIKQRQRELARIHRSKRWKDARDLFLANHPECHYCGKPATTPHHETDVSYGSEEYYDLEKYCIPLCRSCHWYGHHNYELCFCGVGWSPPGSRYCKHCLPIEIKDRALLKKEDLQRIRRENDHRYRMDLKAEREREKMEAMG